MNRQSLPRISIQSLWSLVVLVGIFFFVNTHPIRPQDFWWHLEIGREILEARAIPEIDTFSFTMAGQPYPSYNSFWLMDIILFLLYSWGGPALVVFVQSLLITSAYALLLWLCNQVSGNVRVAALGVFFAASLGFADWNVRPQAITFLLGALFLTAIYAFRKSGRLAWLAAFPLGMLVWVNSHGTFPIGLALLGLWLIEELWVVLKSRSVEGKTRPLKSLVSPAAALAMTSLACLANPSGLGIFRYLRTMGGDPVVQNLVPEWAPPTFDTLHGGLFLTGLLLCSAILALSPRRPRFFDLATFLIFAALGLNTTRGVVWFGLVMAPVLAAHISSFDYLKDMHSRRSVGSPVVNASFLVVLCLMAIVSLPWFKESLPWPGRKSGLISVETPVAATQFLLEQSPPGKVFHAMSFGSYLIWAAQPEYPVFVDSRIELYPPEIWFDYIQISSAIPRWEERLEEYEAGTLMLSPTEQAPLVAAAQASRDWELVYQDDAAIVFVRRNP